MRPGLLGRFSLDVVDGFDGDVATSLLLSVCCWAIHSAKAGEMLVSDDVPPDLTLLEAVFLDFLRVLEEALGTLSTVRPSCPRLTLPQSFVEQEDEEKDSAGKAP